MGFNNLFYEISRFFTFEIIGFNMLLFKIFEVNFLLSEL